MRKAILIAGAAVAAAGSLLLLATGLGAAGLAWGQQPTCDPAAAAADAAMVTAVQEEMPGRDGAAELLLPRVQIPHAVTIQATGAAMGVPARGQEIALATAMQESGLHNLDHADRDSLGLFQQRPSQGWGSAEQILDPAYAARRFYQALLEVPGWQELPLTHAVQAVQRSAYPDAYARWEPLAHTLQEAIATVTARRCDNPAEAAGGDGTGWGELAAGAVPEGYEVPAAAPRAVRVAIAWALAQLGTPYQWGGSCTDPHGPDPMGRCDCSSLVQQAYAAGGVALSRTTYTQVREGREVPLDEVAPGDLLFTTPGDAGPGHVGMAVGSGLVVHAPGTGDVVRLADFASWRPQVISVRRVVD
ncbi:C40 family peptidase [Streptomyces sp. 4N509B]|uniref:C40 family peptidase n=1 Tax=Streptomyces sp. 4N509B TaxID=3457413 RepID=UPI003FD5DD42